MCSARFPIGIRFFALLPRHTHSHFLCGSGVQRTAVQLPAVYAWALVKMWIWQASVMHSDGKSKGWAKHRSGGSRKQTARTQERRAGAGNWTLCFCLDFSRKHSHGKTWPWEATTRGKAGGLSGQITARTISSVMRKMLLWFVEMFPQWSLKKQ